MGAVSSEARMSLGIIGGLVPTGGAVTITHISTGGWDEVYSNTGLAATIANDNTVDLAVGDFVVVCTARGDPSWTTTVTDNATTPNTYTEAINITTAGYYAAIHYSYITTAKTGATITATFGAATTWRAICLSKFTGMSATAHHDQTGNATGTGTAMATTDETTTHDNEIIIVAVHMDGGKVIDPWTNYTKIVAAANWFQVGWRIVTSTGTYHGDGTLATSDTWRTLIATFANE
jgi:hypothetical protein